MPRSLRRPLGRLKTAVVGAPVYGAAGDYRSWAAAAARATPCRNERQQLADLAAAAVSGAWRLRSIALFRAVFAAAGRPIAVLDFGGGSGCDYFALARLHPGAIAAWNIVELPDVVAFGREEFSGRAPPRWFCSIAQAAAADVPDLVVANGVLQCLPQPYDALAALVATGTRFVILDRLPLEPRERFAVFHASSGTRAAWRTIAAPRLDAAMAAYWLAREEIIGRPPGPAAALEVARLYRRR